MRESGQVELGRDTIAEGDVTTFDFGSPFSFTASQRNGARWYYERAFGEPYRVDFHVGEPAGQELRGLCDGVYDVGVFIPDFGALWTARLWVIQPIGERPPPGCRASVHIQRPFDQMTLRSDEHHHLLATFVDDQPSANPIYPIEWFLDGQQVGEGADIHELLSGQGPSLLEVSYGPWASDSITIDLRQSGSTPQVQITSPHTQTRSS